MFDRAEEQAVKNPCVFFFLNFFKERKKLFFALDVRVEVTLEKPPWRPGLARVGLIVKLLEAPSWPNSRAFRWA